MSTCSLVGECQLVSYPLLILVGSGANGIGELFDLERLAETCKELNRWTFFMVSSPFNMRGGISSPPNAQAIF